MDGLYSCSYIFGAILRQVILPSLANCLFPAIRPCERLVLVNHEWVAQEKLRVAAMGMPGMSTNDILTSLIFRTGGCASGLMPVNLRGRVDNLEITNTHAGNLAVHLCPSVQILQAPLMLPVRGAVS